MKAIDAHLHPFEQHGGERGCELHHVAQRQAVKVENHHSAAHLRRRFAHRAVDGDQYGAEQIVEAALGRLPLFCEINGFNIYENTIYCIFSNMNIV